MLESATTRFLACTDLLQLVLDNVPRSPFGPEFQEFMHIRRVCKAWKELADPLAFKVRKAFIQVYDRER